MLAGRSLHWQVKLRQPSTCLPEHCKAADRCWTFIWACGCPCLVLDPLQDGRKKAEAFAGACTARRAGQAGQARSCRRWPVQAEPVGFTSGALEQADAALAQGQIELSHEVLLDRIWLERETWKVFPASSAGGRWCTLGGRHAGDCKHCCWCNSSTAASESASAVMWVDLHLMELECTECR